MLNKTERYFFGKDDRLKSKKVIDTLFKSGNSFSHYPLRVMWLPENHLATLQAGVGVSTRFFKKATDRNRIKRLMRESFRLQKNILATELSLQRKSMSVFILYTGKELPDYNHIYEKTGTVINRLLKCMHEKVKCDPE